MVKNLPANAGDMCSIPVSGRSSGEGNGNPLQYFCLRNLIQRRAWGLQSMRSQRVVHNWVTKHQQQSLSLFCQCSNLLSIDSFIISSSIFIHYVLFISQIPLIIIFYLIYQSERCVIKWLIFYQLSSASIEMDIWLFSFKSVDVMNDSYRFFSNSQHPCIPWTNLTYSCYIKQKDVYFFLLLRLSVSGVGIKIILAS